MNGCDLLTEVECFLSRFISYPSENHRVAHVLWIAHTHKMESWETTPRLAFLSPEPASGKTRALEVTATLVLRPIEAVNVSSAYLFRKVSADDGLPTVLYDEIDALFGTRAGNSEDIRAFLNAGYRRGGAAGRCVIRGNGVETEELPAFCAVAVAGLRELPKTIRTRSIVVPMRPRTANENIEPYRRRIHAAAGERLNERLAAWVETIEVDNRIPPMPLEIADRNADIWEPLLAIADAAGGSWQERARVSAVSLVSQSSSLVQSLGVKLLEDCFIVMANLQRIFTDQLIDRLCRLEESPWGDVYGQRLDSRRLAAELKPYGIRPRQIRVDGGTKKGYQRNEFEDAWARYLPRGTSRAETSETNETVVDFPPAIRSFIAAYDAERRRLCECGGSGCDECGEWKDFDGGELPDVPGRSA